MLFRRKKTIEKAFPTLSTTLTHMCNGIETFAQRQFHIFHHEWPTGTHNGVRIVDAGCCALMSAMWPVSNSYLNTPAIPYGWDFDHTRALIGAIDGLSRSNIYYWDEYVMEYELYCCPREYPEMDLAVLTFASWPKSLPGYRNYINKLKTLGL